MKKAILTILGALAFVLIPAGAVLASAPPPVTDDVDAVSTLVIAAPVVTLIVSLVIPLLNGVLTTATTPTWVKAVGTIVLNAAWALIANGMLADGSTAFSTATLYTAVLGSIISIASYAGVYKPINLTSNSGGKLATVGRS